ncbi:thioredoxin family protein [Leptospira sp. 96542]|nr:thioredoxin family protein [Leptospira sp. 96542]
MKAFFAVLLTFFLHNSIYAETNWETSIQTGFEKAKKEDKFLIVDLYADWCAYCMVLEKDIFPDKDVEKILNGFIKVRLDGEEFPNLKKKYNVEGYPTILFLDSDLNYITKITGLATKEEIIAVSGKVLIEPNLESYLKTELRKKPDAPEIHFRLALVYYRKKDYNGAISSFEKAKEFSQKNSKLLEDIVFNLGFIQTAHGNQTEAIENWKVYIKNFPKSNRIISAKLYYGVSLKNLGENNLAKSVLTEIEPKLSNESEKKICSETLEEIRKGF